MLAGMYREIEALGGVPIMDAYDEGYTDGLNDALAVLRKHGFGVDLAPGPQWQPIETAPKDGTEILGVVAGSSGTASVTCMIEGEWECSDFDEHDYLPCTWWPTHWIPLPSPPTNEEPHAPTNPN